MSTVAELVSRFRETVRESDEGNSHYTNAEIIHWLDAGQNFLCSGIDSIVRQAVRGSTEGQQSYSLPEDFKTCLKVTYDNDKLTSSVPEREDSIDGKWESNPSGRVDKYLIRGDFLYLIDAPKDSDKEIVLTYIAYPKLLTQPEDESQVPVRFQRALLAYALSKGYTKIKQLEMAREYEREFNNWRLEFDKYNIDRNRDLEFVMADQTRKRNPVIVSTGEWIELGG